MNIKVLESPTNNIYVIKQGELSTGYNYYVNGILIDHNLFKYDFILNKDDKLTIESKYPVIINYKKDNELISVEQYQSKPQRFYDDSSDEHVLHCLANKKELEGFEPVYELPTLDVVFEVIGYIEKTDSKFIECYITPKYSTHALLYIVNGRNISLDEYDKLKDKHKDHAKFEIPDRPYLRFTKINNNYVFGDYKPFGDHHYRGTFLTLNDAKKEESDIRDIVKTHVEQAIFKQSLTEYKQIQLLTRLKDVIDITNIDSKNELLYNIINDLTDYTNQCK